VRRDVEFRVESNAEGVRQFQPGVASTPGSLRHEIIYTESVGKLGTTNSRTPSEFILNKMRPPWGCDNPTLEFANAFGVIARADGIEGWIRKDLMRLKKSLSLLLLLTFTFVTSAANEQRATPPEVTLTVNEEFFNGFLESMFTNLKSPSMPLAITASDRERPASENYGCASAVTLQREEAGVKTAVKLEQGKISAPLAFSGAYNSTLLGCIPFRGWAATSWTLEFDRSRQALLAHIQVQDIHLTNVPALASGSLTSMVQSAVDQRMNPLSLLNLDQLSPRVPIAPAGGALRLRAKEVNPIVSPGSLQLRIVYEVAADR